MFDRIGHIVRQVMSGSEVASHETDIAVELAFQNDLTFPCAELASDLQLRGSAHSRYGSPGLTALCICLNRCFRISRFGTLLALRSPSRNTSSNCFALANSFSRFS